MIEAMKLGMCLIGATTLSRRLTPQRLAQVGRWLAGKLEARAAQTSQPGPSPQAHDRLWRLVGVFGRLGVSVDCTDRAWAWVWFLASHGQSAQVVYGVRRVAHDHGWAGHAWVEQGSARWFMAPQPHKEVWRG